MYFSELVLYNARNQFAGGVQQISIMENIAEFLMVIVFAALVLIFIGTGFMYARHAKFVAAFDSCFRSPFNKLIQPSPPRIRRRCA